MEGCISTHFYFIQHYHLALSGSYLNGSDWTKSLISKLLHITHSQWIYRNFTLHDKLCGYLHNKSLEDIKQTIEELADTPPEDIPEGSKFLLEINFGDLTKSHIENQQYWIIALKAAITAGRRSKAAGSRARRIRHRVNRKIPSRSKLGITAVERQIRQDCMHLAANDDIPFPGNETESSITIFLNKKRPHPAAIFAQYRSNKIQSSAVQLPEGSETLDLAPEASWAVGILPARLHHGQGLTWDDVAENESTCY